MLQKVPRFRFLGCLELIQSHLKPKSPPFGFFGAYRSQRVPPFYYFCDSCNNIEI